MIVVTGATGNLGHRILERLLERVPTHEIGASARNPDKASDLAARGVRVRHGDFGDASSLAAAFEGASQVLIVSSNAQASGGDPIAQHKAAIAAAIAAGVRRIVYTSHMGASDSSAFPPMRTHIATERLLRESGVAWTALRNGFYASAVPMMVGDAVSSGVLSAPADGKVAWTAHDDLASAAAHLLSQEGRFDGPTPPLTSSSAMDLTDIAALLAAIHATPVKRRVIADEQQERTMSAKGVPPSAIAMTLGLYRAARAGEFGAVDPMLAELIGRAPIDLRQVLSGGVEG